MTKIAVTGDQGFIGSHFVQRVGQDADVQITPFDRGQYNLFDKESLKGFVSDQDIIIHFAGVNRRADYSEIMEGNIYITYNLISAIKEYNPGTKLIYISSIQAETNLDSVYGVSKKLTEDMLEQFSRLYGLQVGILRLTNVFGPGCRPFHNSVISTFCYQVAKGEQLIVNASDKKFRFIYVDEVMEIVFSKIKGFGQNKFFLDIVDSTNELTIVQLAEIIKALSNNSRYDMIKNQFNISEKFFNDLQTTYQSYLNYRLDLKYEREIDS